ncbi:MAG: HK97-gp10 family putative phage morphogenesis protein [Litorimonas sp.]
MTITVKVEGLKDLESALFGLKTATAKGVGRRTLKKAGAPLADKMRALAPEAQGDLKDAIGVSTKTRRDMRRVDPVEVHVGVATSEGRVAVNQEFGNEDHPAQPFARPAWQGMKMAVLDDIKDTLAVEVAKSVARAERKAARAAAKG